MKDLSINLNLYRTFLYVAKTGSISIASEEMKTDKSVISRNIQQLEELLDCNLFYRDDGMNLSQKGKELYLLVEQSLTNLMVAENNAIEKEDLSTSKITIGALSHLSTFFVMDCIQRIKNDYPKLQIELITGSTVNDLLELLQNHRIDIAIDSSRVGNLSKKMKVKDIRTIKNILIANKPIDIKDIKQLEEYEYILGAKYSNTTNKLINIFEENNLEMKRLLYIDTTELRIEAVKRGLGIGYCMEDIVKNELKNKEIFELKVPFELPESKIHLIYSDEFLTKADKIFIKKYLLK